ncbi:MAG: hypothetical protein EOO04_19635 [Chitinophagaceae bacterium]|nr:MAG: hypothetical protein EOO04_19635 [Chitinophagaceae bacterium]
MTTTNYINTFIAVADDCPVLAAEVPVMKGDKPTAATLQFEMIKNHPYKYDSDSIIFQVYAEKNEITKSSLREEREKFFSKGQACLRASPLTKRYGWGVHSNADGKVAIFALESREYEAFLKNKSLKQVKAMRSNKK